MVDRLALRVEHAVFQRHMDTDLHGRAMAATPPSRNAGQAAVASPLRGEIRIIREMNQPSAICNGR